MWGICCCYFVLLEDSLVHVMLHILAVSDPLFEDALRLIEHMETTFSKSDEAMAALLLEQRSLAAGMTHSWLHCEMY